MPDDIDNDDAIDDDAIDDDAIDDDAIDDDVVDGAPDSPEVSDQSDSNASPITNNEQWLTERFGLEIEDVVQRGFAIDDVVYLLDQCPFLQIVDGVGEAEAFDKVRLDKSPSGWVICNYGTAMASSPGQRLFGAGGKLPSTKAGSDDSDDDDGEGDIQLHAEGSIISQAYQTVEAMIAAAIAQGWGHVKLIDGHPRMLRYAWMEAMRQGIAIEGYAPSDRDKQLQERTLMSQDQMETVRADRKATR